MNLKKIAAFAAAAVLCFACAVPAFAETGSGSVGSGSVGSESVGVVQYNTPAASVTTTIEGDVKDCTIVAVPVQHSGDSAEKVAAAKEALTDFNVVNEVELVLLYPTAAGTSVTHTVADMGSVRVDLKAVFPNVDFAANEYVLLHYITAQMQVEQLPVSADGFVTMTSLSPVALMVKQAAPQPPAPPAPVVPVTPVAPAAPVTTSPKTGEMAIASVLGLMSVVSGAGVVLTRKKK